MGLVEELEGRCVLRHLARSAAALFGLFLRETILMNSQKLLVPAGVSLPWELMNFLSWPVAGQAALELLECHHGDVLLVLCHHDLCLYELEELLWRHSGMNSEFVRFRLPAWLRLSSEESFFGRDL